MKGFMLLQKGKLKKIFFERERRRERAFVCTRTWGWGRERGRERILSRLRTVSTEPSARGLKPTNCEIIS